MLEDNKFCNTFLGFNVLDPELNVLGYRFLEASAGTGKTFAIEHLYVRWILEGIPLRHILVVTFTQAATRELIERIHNRLKASQKTVSSQEQFLLLEAALASFDEAKIHTIHGFCQSMLKRFYLESNCQLAFSDEQKLWEEWVDFLRGHLDREKLSARQIELFFGRKFEEKLAMLVKAWKPFIDDPLPDFSQVPRLLEKQLEAIPKLSFEQVIEDLQQLTLIYRNFTQYDEQYAIIAKWCESHIVTREEVERLIDQKEFFLDAIKTAEKKKQQKANSWHIPELISMLQAVFLPLVVDLSDKKKIQNKLLADFSFYRSKHPVLSTTPDELLYAMKQALQNKSFFEAVQGQFQAVVIDEFQDTDELQWQIFNQLFLQSRTLKAFCLVGDPKQSIYAFRAADLYTYLVAKTAFLPQEIASLTMNYRSKKPLVGALNALFTSPGRAGWMHLPKLGQALEIIPVEAADASTEILPEKGSVHVVIAKQGQDLFHYLAQQVQFWEKQGVIPKEMAILVKDRFEARKLIKFLHDLGIKTHYSSEGHLGDTLTFDAMVDLLALIEKPRDAMRLKKVLAGPLVAWPAESLMEEPFDAAFSLLMSGVQKLIVSFEEKGLAAFLKMFFEEPLFDSRSVAENLLLDDDIHTYEEFQQIVELLIETCSRQGMSLLQMRLFLLKIKQEKRFDEEGYEKRSSIDDNAVEITTIFKSKGLEYEVVFPLALATGRIKNEEDEERIAEKMRLFYVAMTRAKRCVYLPWISAANSRTPSITELFFQSCFGSLDQQIVVEALRGFGEKNSLVVEELQEINSDVLAEALVASLEIPPPSVFTKRFAPRQMISFSSLSKTSTEEKEDALVPKCSLLKEEEHTSEVLPLGAETGKFVHNILEGCFRKSLHCPYDREKLIALIEKEAETTPFEAIKEEVTRLIEGVFHVPIQPIVGFGQPFCLKEIEASALMPEMEFVYEQKGNLCKGFIDLVFFHDGLFYLVDWKTNWLPEYSLEQLAASIQEKRYDMQASIYVEALRRYVKLFDDRPFEDCFGGAYYFYLRGMRWIQVLP